MTRTTLARHATAIAVVLLTFAAKGPIERLVGPGPPLIFYVPSVTISAWQGGLGAGSPGHRTGLALSAITTSRRSGRLRSPIPNDVARLVAFVFEGILTSILMEWLHLARRQAEESRRTANEFREASRRADDRFRAIIDNTDALIFMKNMRLEYDVMNRKLRETFGVAEGKVTGLTDFDVYPKEVAERIQVNDRSVLEQAKAMQFEQVIPLGDGCHTYLFSEISSMLDSAGVPYAIAGISTDITPLKVAQKRAVHAERLAAIGQMATGLAHEGRNALQNSQICLELLTRQLGDRPEALELVAGIQKAQDDLHRLYEEVRGYAAPIVLDRRSCRIGDLLHEAWDRLAPSRTGRDAELRERGDPDLSCSGDAFRLVQVFRNILDNALAAAHDPVVIDVEWTEVNRAMQPSVEIVIRDNGPGLTPEQRSNLFEPFFTTKTHGTGLGMAIAKRIIDAHEGTIAAGIGSGRGATILITSTAREQMTAALSIAVADDEPRMRDYYSSTLPLLGHRVVVAARDGREMVRGCRKARPGPDHH